MSITFDCNNCGTRLGVAAGLAGKRVRCKRCGAVLQVPDPSDPEPDCYGFAGEPTAHDEARREAALPRGDADDPGADAPDEATDSAGSGGAWWRQADGEPSATALALLMAAIFGVGGGVIGTLGRGLSPIVIGALIGMAIGAGLGFLIKKLQQSDSPVLLGMKVFAGLGAVFGAWVWFAEANLSLALLSVPVFGLVGVKVGAIVAFTRRFSR